MTKSMSRKIIAVCICVLVLLIINFLINIINRQTAVTLELPESSITIPEPSSLSNTMPEPVKQRRVRVPKPMEDLEDLTGKAKSFLNGYYIDEELVKKRPVAVVINNLKKALPQSGLSQADIIYEVLAEGDITRLVAIFQNYDSKKIGPVRSARHYFLNFARDNNAIFVHHGGSTQGYSDISRLGVNNIDGMRSGAFWRDAVRFNQPGMYEHSSYTDAEKIADQAVNYKYDTEVDENYKGMFKFYDDFTMLTGESANTVKVPFSSSQNATFTYDATDKVYRRYQHNQEHIDEETGDQLKVSNVIIQLAEMYVISGDEYGRREVKLISSGTGYLITGGKSQSITWSKESYASPTKWLDEKGLPLTLNKGKTWICVTDIDDGVTIE